GQAAGRRIMKEDPKIKQNDYIIKRCSLGVMLGSITGLIFFIIDWRKTRVAWCSIWVTFTGLSIVVFTCALLMTHYHIFGTDKIGRDVFYLTLKSIRTGLIIGTITTLFTLPFALFLGTIAGYFRGFADDIIQYSYTPLSSIPAVLLIAA